MNFGDFWQEHRKYVTATVAGLVAVLVAKLIIGLAYDRRLDSAKSKFDRAKTEQARALPAGVDVAAVKRMREALETQFDGLRAAVHRTPKPEMTTSGVSDPDLHYNAQIERIRTTVLENCALRDIDVDHRLGLPDAFPGSRGEIEHYLRGLDAVEQLIRACLAAEAKYEGGVRRMERIEIEKAQKQKAGAAARARPFTTPLVVETIIIGHPLALDEIMRSFTETPGGSVAAGRRLVLQEATLRSLDIGPASAVRDRRGADPLDLRRAELRLKVAALDVDPEGKV